jgi:hypothetical protein
LKQILPELCKQIWHYRQISAETGRFRWEILLSKKSANMKIVHKDFEYYKGTKNTHNFYEKTYYTGKS